jgi:hypothetical protein
MPQKGKVLGAAASMECHFLNTVGTWPFRILWLFGVGGDLNPGAREAHREEVLHGGQKFDEYRIEGGIGLVIDQETFSRTRLKELEIPITTKRIEKRGFASWSYLASVIYKSGTTMCQDIGVEGFTVSVTFAFLAAVIVLIEELFASRVFRLIRFESG